MTYLPKSNGSDDENADQAEELEVRAPEMFAYAAIRKIMLFRETNTCSKNHRDVDWIKCSLNSFPAGDVSVEWLLLALKVRK